MNKTLTRPRALWGAAVAIAALAISTVTPIASANTYSAPSAPTNVVATASATGIKVRWTRSADVSPAITHYIISAGAGSCPIISRASNPTSVTLPVLAGQTTITPVVQAVNAYGISAAAKANKSFTAASLVGTMIRTDLKSVQFLQFSDFHGALEASATSMGAAVMASSFAAERVKNPNTITVSSGDNIGAAPQISSAFEEIPTIEAMNLMKVDASVFGNHEHDRNVAHLAKVIGASEFQWVASNYSTLSGLESGTKAAKEYTIIERGGLKIGIVGYNTSQTKEQVFPGNLMTPSGKEIVIDPSVETVNKAIKAAKAAGADFVIALVHEGWTENLEGKAEGPLPAIAKEIQGAAIVYGGHSHLTYSSSNPGTVRTAPTLLAQVVNSGSEYTRSAVCFDTSRSKVLGSSVEYVKKADVATVAADATAAAMVKKYKDQLSPKLDVKVGSVSDQFPRGGTPAVERSGENPTGNYTTDVIRAKYKVDFVLTNGGGIRDTLPAKTYTPADKTLKRPATGSTGPYDVTLGDALTVYPFGNSVSTTTITGAGLWKALENGVSNFPTDGRFPQISGFKFTWDSTKAKMSRIVSVTTLDGKAIAADSKEYTIATLDFLVQGGDGYAGTFAPSKSKVRDLLVDVLIEALKADMAAGKVTKMPAADGRIVKVA